MSGELLALSVDPLDLAPSVKDLPFNPKEPFFSAAVLYTLDYAEYGFVESLRACNPDGYIIGIGAGGIFYYINCFAQGTAPKGLIGIDYDPHVVAAGLVMID